MWSWVRLLKCVSTKLKRAAQPGRTHELVGRFLYLRGWLPLKKQHQLGAAGRERVKWERWQPAAQGTLYSGKGQGFLPGRTGLNPLHGIPLATRGLGEEGFALPPPAGGAAPLGK